MARAPTRTERAKPVESAESTLSGLESAESTGSLTMDEKMDLLIKMIEELPDRIRESMTLG